MARRTIRKKCYAITEIGYGMSCRKAGGGRRRATWACGTRERRGLPFRIRTISVRLITWRCFTATRASTRAAGWSLRTGSIWEGASTTGRPLFPLANRAGWPEKGAGRPISLEIAKCACMQLLFQRERPTIPLLGPAGETRAEENTAELQSLTNDVLHPLLDK